MKFKIISWVIGARRYRRTSRQSRSTWYSFAYPNPPNVWRATSQAWNPASAASSLAALASRPHGRPWSYSHAAFGDSVFVVAELKDAHGQTYRGVRQQFVKVGAGRGDQISVLSGLKAGEEVVTSGVFKLRNGAAVLVNNKVRPGNNPKPRPENS